MKFTARWGGIFRESPEGYRVERRPSGGHGWYHEPRFKFFGWAPSGEFLAHGKFKEVRAACEAHAKREATR